jgi:sodium-dependent dicarboxylate transporter 2/3/5
MYWRLTPYTLLFSSLLIIAIAIWMAALWVTEFIPLVITSLLPIVLFPLFGILPSAAVTANYANDTTFLFMAGVFMAMALERWDLHRRFSMKILSWFGCKPQSIMIGFMVATFILSMFISNTAATLMMIPNATGVLQSLRSTNCDTGDNGDRHSTDQLAKGVLLGIAYAANTGGLASYIGTPTNLVLASQLQAIFPDAPAMNFLKWLKFGLPIGILIAICIWAYLSLQYIRKAPPVEGLDHTFFKKRYADMGPWTREQMIVTSIFFIEICLWISKPGWEILFKDGFVTDTTVGMLMGLMLFIIPAKSRNLSKDAIGYDEDDDDEDEEKPEITTILDWRTANTMPWDISTF